MPSSFVNTRSNLQNCHVHSLYDNPALQRIQTLLFPHFTSPAETIHLYSDCNLTTRRPLYNAQMLLNLSMCVCKDIATAHQILWNSPDWHIRFCSLGIFWMLLLFPFIWDLDIEFSFVYTFVLNKFDASWSKHTKSASYLTISWLDFLYLNLNL